MKYGDTLHQRSPPEWEAYNVDYNEIKAIIKHHTTGSKAAAITIPGQSHHDADFEQELYRELVDQHQRVDLFVRSKTGEIKRRLDHLYKLATHLRSTVQVAERKRISVRKLEKFSRLETDTLRAGEEIQALARYIGAQRVAFIKLLKKYRKWTGASKLADRFNNNVIDKPRSFENQDLDPLLVQYNEILGMVRAPFEAGFSWRVSAENPQKATRLRTVSTQTVDGTRLSSSAVLYKLFDNGSNIEIDTAFGSLPLGSKAGHVAYWVHNDNLLQLHILLLQHMRLKRGSSVAPTPAEPTAQPPSPTHLIESSLGKLAGQSISGEMVCDDLNTFAKGRSGKTIEQLETRTGQRPDDSAATIRYSSSGESIVVVNSVPGLKWSDGNGSCIATRRKFKEKELGPLLKGQKSSRSEVSEVNMDTPADGKSILPDQPETVRAWFERQQAVEPLVDLRAKRARFGGLSNDGVRGVWAIVNRDVQMRRPSDHKFDLSESEEFKPFPHSILEVRWEGQEAPPLVQQLDTSHLVERVPGFSLQVHAVAVLCESDMPAPYWLSILDRDIRKIPQEPTRVENRRSSIPASHDASSTHRASVSAASNVDFQSSGGFSKGQVQSSATSIQEVTLPPPAKPERSRRKTRKTCSRNRSLSGFQRKEEARYWNEFDDGDESEENEAYTVLVDPNTPAPLIDVWTSLKSLLWAQRVGYEPTERSPLLPADYFAMPDGGSGNASGGGATSDSPSTPGSPVQAHRPSLPSRYSVFPTYHSISEPLEPLSEYHVERRDVVLVRCAAAAFVVSFAMMLMAGTLELALRRKHYALAADVGIIFGIAASMVSAVAGVGLSAARQMDVGWMNRTQVGLAFALVCVGNGVLVVVLAGA